MMRETKRQTDLDRAAALLRRARHTIALTGAGISTPSGIPDFRTPGEGLWEKVDPMEVASIRAFRRDPEAFYRWMGPTLDLIRDAEPNPAHRALARLETAGRLEAVVTQNIDGLHQRAGSQRVLELHGHLRTASCLGCFRRWPSERFLEVVERGEAPRCPTCGGIVKPDAILFGEQLPAEAISAAMDHAERADLLLVAGSSLTVMPAANIPALVHSRGGAVIIFNQQTTYANAFAVAAFRENVAEILPRVVDRCLEEEE